MAVYALTRYETSIKDCIMTPAMVKNVTTGSSEKTNGIWDTGATNSCITRDLANKLGLKPVSMAQVLGVHGKQVVNVYVVEVTLNNQNITVRCNVTEAATLSDDDSVGLLIGMNIINLGDFCITNYNGKTTMTFRVPSIETVDYVAEINQLNQYQKINAARAKHKVEKCPCGSGKLYKNCHGKNKYGIF